ncbi:MAG: SPASM domain-containing protein [bacterium]|nr:SPASM domain-containing protein [bacterium]
MQRLPVLSREAISDDLLRNWPLSYLREIQIELGKQCNVRCIMCYQTDFSPATRAAEIIWKERLAPAYPNAETISFSGGEPTILPGAIHLLKTVLDGYPHLKLNAVSNGIQFKGIWEDAFLKMGGELNISLNAVSPDVYAKVVQFGRQQDVMANIDRLIARRASEGSNLWLRISMVVLDETVQELGDFIQWAADHGIDEVMFHTDYLSGIRRTPAETVRKHVAHAYDVADRNPQVRIQLLESFDRVFALQHGLEPIRPQAAKPRATRPCNIPFDYIAINPDGSAFPCCKSWYTIGNLVKSDLQTVWTSPAAYKFRRRMLGMDFGNCMVACDMNANPAHPKIADARKAVAVFRREPKSAVKKGLRRFGLTSAQIELPEGVKPKATA